MKIQEQDRYHGPALMQIVEFPKFKALNRADDKYGHYIVNNDRYLLVKYCKSRSAGKYRFTFTPDDLEVLRQDYARKNAKTFVILVCGQETICVLSRERVNEVVDLSATSQQQITASFPKGGGLRVGGAEGDAKGVIPHKAFPELLFD